MDIIDNHNVTQETIDRMKTCPFLTGDNMICVDISDNEFWGQILVNIVSGISNQETGLGRKLNQWRHDCGRIDGVSEHMYRVGSVFPKGTHQQALEFYTLGQYVASNMFSIGKRRSNTLEKILS
jgi:hypothetical protein